MTIIDTRQVPTAQRVRPRPTGIRRTSAQARRRPGPARPPGAPLRYLGAGIAMPRGPHRPRPVGPVMTVVLALLAAVITVWLGLVAKIGGVVGTSTPVPDRLAVIQVQAGETLQHVAARVAPNAPVGQVVERIRALNALDSAALDAGQTLIAPVG